MTKTIKRSDIEQQEGDRHLAILRIPRETYSRLLKSEGEAFRKQYGSHLAYFGCLSSIGLELPQTTRVIKQDHNIYFATDEVAILLEDKSQFLIVRPGQMIREIGVCYVPVVGDAESVRFSHYDYSRKGLFVSHWGTSSLSEILAEGEKKSLETIPEHLRTIASGVKATLTIVDDPVTPKLNGFPVKVTKDIKPQSNPETVYVLGSMEQFAVMKGLEPFVPGQCQEIETPSEITSDCDDQLVKIKEDFDRRNFIEDQRKVKEKTLFDEIVDKAASEVEFPVSALDATDSKEAAARYEDVVKINKINFREFL